MKCMYYLAPSLVSTHQISDDLHSVGISDWLLHIISKDEAGLKREKLHSSNWFETTDLLRDGFIGANFGFIAGALLAGAFMVLQPFGPNVPGVALFFLVVVATLFGLTQRNIQVSVPAVALEHAQATLSDDQCAEVNSMIDHLDTFRLARWEPITRALEIDVREMRDSAE